MPYKSEAQRKFFNSPAGKEKIGKEEVEHWNEVSKGMKLPEKAVDRAIKTCDEDKWITVNGSHVKVDENGSPVAGNKNVLNAMKGKNANKENKAGSKKAKVGTDIKTKSEYKKFFDDMEVGEAVTVTNAYGQKETYVCLKKDGGTPKFGMVSSKTGELLDNDGVPASMGGRQYETLSSQNLASVVSAASSSKNKKAIESNAKEQMINANKFYSQEEISDLIKHNTTKGTMGSVKKISSVDKAIKACDELSVYAIIYSPKNDKGAPRHFAYVAGSSESEAVSNLKKKYEVATVHSVKKAPKNSREYKQVMAMATGNNKFD